MRKDKIPTRYTHLSSREFCPFVMCNFMMCKKQHLTPLTLRDLMRGCRFLRNRENAQEILDQLEIYGYLSRQNSEPRTKVGRPSNPIYDVNPWVFERT